MKFSCVQCGAKFRRKRKDQRSCSPACRKLAYESSAKARARKRKYEASAKGKAAAERYAASSKGQARQLRHYYKDRPGQLRIILKDRARWTKDVHRYAEMEGISLFEALSVLTQHSLEDEPIDIMNLHGNALVEALQRLSQSRPEKVKKYVQAARALGWKLALDRYGRFQRDTQRKLFLDAWYWRLQEERRTSSVATPAAGPSTSATGVVLVD